VADDYGGMDKRGNEIMSDEIITVETEADAWQYLRAHPEYKGSISFTNARGYDSTIGPLVNGSRHRTDNLGRLDPAVNGLFSFPTQ
jgi:hypothetical protein